MIGSWSKFLFKKVPIYPLVTFRIVFGLLMIISTSRFMYLGWIEDHFVNTQFQFKYYGFEWLTLLPPFWMYFIHCVMLISALGLMLGFLYRLSVILLFLTFTYTELLDLTYYLNHYYFVSLVCLLLIFIPANKFLSIDCRIWPKIASKTTEAWHVNILKFQIFVVYFFAGIAKINEDWLIHALPMKIWLPANDAIPFLGSIFSHSWSPYLFSWIGMFYDTFIVFFLLFKPTRIYAYFLVILFHATVGLLFQIGVFPVVMIGVTLIFFSNEWHEKWILTISNVFPKSSFGINQNHLRVRSFGKRNVKIGVQVTTILVTGYILIQVLLPLRYLAYPGNLFWTEEGFRFSWRVMLMEKAGTATFYIKDLETGREGVVNNNEFLNAHQEKQMSFQPDMILQFAHFLGEHYKKTGKPLPEVRLEAWVTLNSRPSQLIIDPEKDLMKVHDSWEPKNWIIPIDKD
jgi:hypothetical protein